MDSALPNQSSPSQPESPNLLPLAQNCSTAHSPSHLHLISDPPPHLKFSKDSAFKSLPQLGEKSTQPNTDFDAIELHLQKQNTILNNQIISKSQKQLSQEPRQNAFSHQNSQNYVKSQAKLSSDDLKQNEIQLNEQKMIKNTKKRQSQKLNYDEQQDYEEKAESYRFPYLNEHISTNSQEYLRTMQVLDKLKDAKQCKGNDTFVNCDVRYFNWNLFLDEVGKFDILIIDPPWRIKGAQQNDSQFMFSNCKFSLEYNTMANSEIARIPLHLISDEGFIFLWILNSQLDDSLEIMQTWGYELVDELVWVKLKDNKISLTHGYYFMHSYEICLVGYKNKNQKQKLQSGESTITTLNQISSNTIFAEVREKSQKPEDLYAVIDMMFKGKKKIEIFARNHNMKFGIFSVGNELGQSYDKWLLTFHCDKCQVVLKCGVKRFKAKNTANYDLCDKCILTEERSNFFELANDVDENVRHEYVSCNHCGAEPIWGIRFQCVTCHDFDLCENCFDKNLQVKEKFHPIEHEYMFLEVPVFGNGFHIHESKCTCCYQNPIIGIHFTCTQCKNFKLCQKCFFERPRSDLVSNNKRHKQDHQLEVIFEPQVQWEKRYQCFNCKSEILENCWMCENCYNFFFCSKCHAQKDQFKSLYANAHKKFHVYSKIF